MEGDALFLVAASRGQDRAAPGLGAPAHFGEEAGLTDPGTPGKGEQPAPGPTGRLGSVPERGGVTLRCWAALPVRCGA
ncbi:hypothetical protein GCM10010372_56160 [Streptomyces tauricus]|nr:hypothetical protein GCM10010372_56160 [Streptomyces tauricus]